MGCVYMEVLKRYIFTCSMGSTIWNKQKKTSIGKRWEGNLTELIFDKFSTFSHFLKVFIMNMDYFWRIKKKKKLPKINPYKYIQLTKMQT